MKKTSKFLSLVYEKSKFVRYIYGVYRKDESKKLQYNLKKKQERINNISETFCTAKWLQVSLLLHNGTNHSCHHPPQHKITLDDIKDNPSGLHNTLHKKERRKLMLQGERPAECSYCWDIEDLGHKYISDRIIKSTNEEWSYGYLNQIVDVGADININPTYLEVAFESTCNLKCAYCSPDISSSWFDEIKKFGPYPTRFSQGDLSWIEKKGKLPINKEEDNEYIKAFWKWWPEVYPGLKTFRITGGEPLLSSSTWKVLNLIKEQPKKDLTLSINTNLCVIDKWIEKLIKYSNDVSTLVNKFEIHTSCEATGKQAEYIRFGMKYEPFIDNIEKLLNRTGESVKINIMITFNVLSCSSFISFMEEIKRLRVLYKRRYGYEKITFLISYLRWPQHLSVRVMPFKLRVKYVKVFREYLRDNINSRKNGFLQEAEVDQINRLCEYMSEDIEGIEIKKDREDFKSFINEYDLRKNLNFIKIFPEYVDYMNW
jgi:MoaA/NifB/PqqE/SkfB family radical SAM enzyme